MTSETELFFNYSCTVTKQEGILVFPPVAIRHQSRLMAFFYGTPWAQSLDTPHSAGPLWTGDQPDLHLTTHNTHRERHSCPHNPNIWASSNPYLRPLGHWDRHVNLNNRITLNLSIKKKKVKLTIRTGKSKKSQNVTGVVRVTRRVSGRFLTREASGGCECRWEFCNGHCSSETGFSSSTFILSCPCSANT
jgi:hypothetical protein